MCPQKSGTPPPSRLNAPVGLCADSRSDTLKLLKPFLNANYDTKGQNKYTTKLTNLR